MLPKKNSMVVTGVVCICENKMKKKRISKAHLTLSYKNRKLERQLPSKKCKLIKRPQKPGLLRVRVLLYLEV